MPIHVASESDLEFQRAFEAGELQPSEFNHLAHLRLAYIYLIAGDPEHAESRMRQSLLAFLDAKNISRAKFHKTITRAWVMAVSHFMNRSDSRSFSEFSENSQPLLDSKVMLTHYSAEALFSASARAAFVEPDLVAIPR